MCHSTQGGLAAHRINLSPMLTSGLIANGFSDPLMHINDVRNQSRLRRYRGRWSICMSHTCMSLGTWGLKLSHDVLRFYANNVTYGTSDPFAVVYLPSHNVPIPRLHQVISFTHLTLPPTLLWLPQKTCSRPKPRRHCPTTRRL